MLNKQKFKILNPSYNHFGLYSSTFFLYYKK